MVLFKDVIEIDNGAQFHNSDLHIHSYGGSHDVKDLNMTPENIVESAVAQGLGVIAITDHNSIENVQRAIDYTQEHYAGRLLCLPGVEITTAHGHLLVYFAPERITDLNKFLSRIDLIGDMGKENTRTGKSMSDTILEADKLGGICIAAHIDRDKTGFDAFTPGFPNWKRDIINSPGLYGLECDAIEVLSWYSEDDEVGSEGVVRKNMLNDRQAVPGLSARHHLAHVQGSDAHSMDQFAHQIPEKSWTRIKLTEFSFEAFRIALIDPKARVRANASIPRFVPRIHGVAITGGFLHKEIIHFSDNLNCLIGGRGTGKSTAIRAIAYALGLYDEFGEYDNCPDLVTVFCEDENGIIYRYVRARSGDIEVTAKDDQSLNDVPVDAFRIEYFGQGELAKVAENPLKNPQLFQDFLDRHTNLRDLIETEENLVASLRENASQLKPLEIDFQQLETKRKTLKEIEKKLKIAEEGNLRQIVGQQSRLASEKTIQESIEAIAIEYHKGFTFSKIQRDFDQIVRTAGTCTDDKESILAIAAIKKIISENNIAVRQKEKELNELLKQCSKELMKRVANLKTSRQRMNAEVATNLAKLKTKGVATNIQGLDQLLRQKTSTAKEIATVEQRSGERKEAQRKRQELRTQLEEIRQKMIKRRKEQLRTINTNLGRIIKDYTIFVKYDDEGITTNFESFVQEKMQGTYLQANIIENLCRKIQPSELADLVFSKNHDKIASVTGISKEWAEKIGEKLFTWTAIFELQAIPKRPKPVIKVLTKSVPAKEIPVHQLSDGQRHTILLTIAMLAESNVPLVIDQPEDDLDNAFIFSSIVSTLRAIKEKRQVILVTHNANIAVLGDSELLLPMYRENDYGKTMDRGAIDASKTKQSVLDILEGGSKAFLKRKEMYNH